VIEAPATLHATDCIGYAGDGKQSGEDEERGSAVVGEVGQKKSDGETGENQEVAAQKRVGSRVEEGMFHANTTSRISAQLVWCQFARGMEVRSISEIHKSGKNQSCGDSKDHRS
jgi:hypothetical protein